MSRRRQEDTDIDQYFLKQLDDAGIDRRTTKRNVTTAKSGLLRGDLWISTVPHTDSKFEEKIVALIECKDRRANIDDKDWLDAKRQGTLKAQAQGLKSYIVTNTDNLTRCYNAFTDDEIKVDGTIVSNIPSLAILQAIQTQVSPNNSKVAYRSFSSHVPNPKRFRSSLWNLRQTFRSAGISKGGEDSIIKTTLTFCILKIISEQQAVRRTIPGTIFLWDDWREGQLHRDMINTVSDLVALPEYGHLKDCLYIDDRLDNKACKTLKDEIGKYSLFNSDFDFFGIIYESYANKELKKDFGEFYTPRHVIQFIVATLLDGERTPRDIAICDPACGTGGFLVEAFLFLKAKYEEANLLSDASLQRLKNNVFVGLDTNERVAIPYARTNMMMAGDGGTKINGTADSLLEDLDSEFDYVLANIPYGLYAGDAKISNFSFTNSKRYELLFLEKIVHSLKPGGRAAVIVPDSVVEATSYSSVRLNFLYAAEVEAVISLPPYIFEPYTSEKTYILYFRRKMPSGTGRLQTSPVWQCVIDYDGFAKGKKRYPINDDDFPEVQLEFRKGFKAEKYGFVPMSEINDNNFYNLASEHHLRRPRPVELELKTLSTLIDNLEAKL